MKNQFIILLTGILFIVSCSKTEKPFVCGDTITDIDGNVYNTVKIGSQCWTVENLKTSKYNDGMAIPNITDNDQWKADTIGAYCLFDNADSNNAIYGKLYNWNSVKTGKLAPSGWHVPSDAEWTTLYNQLGGDSIAGGAMKDTIRWQSVNVGATNSSGFTGLPAGYRYFTGLYIWMGRDTYFWSTTEQDATYAWACHLTKFDDNGDRRIQTKGDGLSIRCIKD
jgi:uncharacterized protein (TIGR02145 family)